MKPNLPRKTSPRTSLVRVGLAALVAVVGAVAGTSGCLNRPLCDEDCRPRTTNIFVDTIQQKQVDKIDLLFMIDNSISMADKQVVLKDAVPDLVRRLVNPDCVDAVTGERKNETPADPSANCTVGVREFNAIKDIHIGVITSSLGGHGAALCQTNTNNIKREQEDDRAHLIASRPRFAALLPPTGQQPEGPGFLDWNPPKRGGNQDLGAFVATFQAMTQAAGEYGCGFEASLEAVYRFLSDPAPALQIQLQPCSATNTNPCAFPSGIDEELKAQRAAFLRPDSLVAIALLSDENDCSIRDSQQYYFAASKDVTLKQGSSVCASNPNDACCYSCLTAPPSGCAPDPACDQTSAVDKEINLRCFDQKRRFGLDFLYPVQRYVNALSQATICPSHADLNPAGCPDAQPNPLYSPPGALLPRDSSLVFFAGIIGVPWQDIKADTRVNDLGETVPVDPNVLRYKTASELEAGRIWDIILGDPAASPPVLPADALMIEQIGPRAGNGPIGPTPADQGTLQGPNAGMLANPANGHEWNNTGQDDLQYACIFKLPATKNCQQIEEAAAAEAAARPNDPTLIPKQGCDCGGKTVVEDQNPLCESTSGVFTPIQGYAKAYPGIRELQVLKGFGANSIVASICARNVDDPTRQDYGYRPAVDAIVDRLKEALTGKCLPRKLAPDPQTGAIPCSIIEAVPRASNCDGGGRAAPRPEVRSPALKRLEQAGACGGETAVPCTSFTLCEIQPAGDKLSCENDEQYVAGGSPGWCYVDPDEKPKGSGIGNKALVRKCAENQRRILRFVDPANQTPAPDAKVLIACFGADLSEDVAGGTVPPPAAGAGGAVTVGLVDDG